MTKCLLDLLILLTILPCLKGGRSFVIEPKSWDFRGHPIGYEVSRKTISPTTTSTGIRQSRNETAMDVIPRPTPILLLNGFGVGSFHQHRLIPRLLESNDADDLDISEVVVYGIDYLGQGRSWPKDCDDGQSENEKGLRYCANTWVDQVIQFIEQVILPEHQGDNDTGSSRVHLIGNSVGGHLAAHIAVRRPDLIASIGLLNPTPVWGLNLPGWSGHLPAPLVPKVIGRYLFDRIRDLSTIEQYLTAAYARQEAFDEELMTQIRGCTLGKGGHAAFASILWSPPLMVPTSETDEAAILSRNFQDCLAQLQCDVLLVFGKDDPWCKPAFAKKMLQALATRDPRLVHRYVEVENCGHCPNHEAPQSVARVVKRWIHSNDRRESQLRLVNDEKEVIVEPWGETVIRERKESDIELSLVDRLAVTFV